MDDDDHFAVDKEQSTEELHRKRIKDLQESALEADDPRRAVILIATSKIMDIGNMIADAIANELSKNTSSLKTVQEAVPAINSLTLLHRQATRYFQLDREVAAEAGSEAHGRLMRKTPR